MTKPLPYDARRYKPTVINCESCGERHVAHRPAKFCSPRCRQSAARAAHRGADDRLRCQVCGVARPPDEFARSKTCRACRSALARVRRAARVAAFIACRMCRVAKPPSEFYRNQTSRTGQGSTCKACCRALARLRRSRPST